MVKCAKSCAYFVVVLMRYFCTNDFEIVETVKDDFRLARTLIQVFALSILIRSDAVGTKTRFQLNHGRYISSISRFADLTGLDFGLVDEPFAFSFLTGLDFGLVAEPFAFSLWEQRFGS